MRSKSIHLGIALVAVLACPNVSGDDGAASVGLGGIQLVREARISMEKERLTISAQKVSVEFEFLNQADKDLTTEVAFPIPAYDQKYLHASYPKGVDDFQVWVEGREIKYQIEAKAMLNGVDYSATLRKFGVDVASLGHFTDSDPKRNYVPYSPDIERISNAQRDELKRLGLIRRDNGFMGWTVVKTYHWQQTFPAHKILHVRHKYAPILGSGLTSVEDISPAHKRSRSPSFAALVRDCCIDAALQNKLVATSRVDENSSFIEAEWVDYILTTANTWRTPIKSFELIVERPKPKPPSEQLPGDHWMVSFCWPGPVRQFDADHFLARAINFVPSRELHIEFFAVK